MKSRLEPRVIAAVCVMLITGSACTTPTRQAQPSPAYPRPGAVKLLENDRVIIWRVTFEKGVPTPLHKHTLDKITVFLQDVTIQDSSVDGKREVWEAKAGDTYYSPKGTVHVEEGLSEPPRDVIVVELK
jgi:quercetin dioxygenase-like cupin family protein